MRLIDLESWNRRDHFYKFRDWDWPHFSLGANIDITAFVPVVKQNDYSFTAAVMYLVARTANAIPEFRQRIHGEDVVEYDIVHPSCTILTEDDLFSFCTVDYSEDFSLFTARYDAQVSAILEERVLEDTPGEDNLLFMSSIPWVSFTSFMHPLKLYPADSVPRFAWGKYFKEDNSLKMPFSIQAHHALMDGVHAGRFFLKIQDLLQQPEILLGTG